MAGELICDECGRSYKSQRGLDDHVADKHPRTLFGPVAEATEAAITAATHLTDMDKGTLEVLRVLACKIDAMGEPDPEWDGEDAQPFDNVTIPTYLKYATELALTPLGRLKLGAKSNDEGKSRLAQLRSIHGGRAG